MKTLVHNHILFFMLSAGLFVLAGLLIPVSANVTLTKFEPVVIGNKIQVSWITATETNNAGFNVYRSESATVPTTAATKLNPNLIPPKGFGATGGSYTFDDTAVVAGKKYYYKLESLDAKGGAPQYSDIKSATITAPTNTPVATATKTNTPAPTATRTSTLVPGAPTFTPAPTDPPTPIPTATNTLVPGAPTFTPAPKATPTAPRIAVAPKPGALTDPAPAVAPNAPVPDAGANPTPINLAPQSANSSAEDEFAEDMPENDAQSPAPAWRSLALVGVLLTAGGIGFVGVLLFSLAALFFVRAQSRR